ncbi:MAG: DUF4214 domain-containing protein [Bdellovibrionales bacterium]|nr:DUF4214 domain-containing protein [Bdellovibrionales bacterium]NQZ20123.1 DUF4214 domain-containing protein [Bdellovibrionales bacterium]
MFFKNNSGNALMGTVIASGVTAVLITAMGQQFLMATQQKNMFVSDIDASSLQMDIKRSLSTNQLCNIYFKSENTNFDSDTATINMRLTNNEVISNNTTLSAYNLKNINLTVDSTQNLGTNADGDIFYSANLTMTMERKNSKFVIRPRNIGLLYINTQSDGTIIDCNMTSLFELVTCDADELKVSTGNGTIPVCRTSEQLIGSVCPSGQIIVSTGEGVRCTDMPRPPAPVVAAAPTPSSRGGSVASAGKAAPQTCTAAPAVCAAYRNQLGRTPDQAGADYWTAQMNDWTKQFGAQEAVRRLNQSIGGSAEARGVQRSAREVANYNRHARNTGTSSARCTGSTGCGNTGQSTNARLVENVYNGVLGRSSDSAGKDYWIKQANRMASEGKSSAEITRELQRNFRNSEEYKNK